MNCQKIIKLLNPYVDQVLDAESTQTVEEHLKSCPTCHEEYLKLKQVVSALNSISPQSAPVDFTQNIMAKISQEEVKIKTSWIDNFRKRIHIPRFSFRLVGVTATAALIVFFAFNFIFNTPSTPSLCSSEVNFSLKLGDNKAHTVAIAGDFNGWNPQVNLLKSPDKDNIWTGTLKLQPGRYEYMFVIDGKEWVSDPNAIRYVKDGFGNKNAVLEINSCNRT